MRRLTCIDSLQHVRYRQREYLKINDHLCPQGTYTLKKQTDPETFIQHPGLEERGLQQDVNVELLQSLRQSRCYTPKVREVPEQSKEHFFKADIAQPFVCL